MNILALGVFEFAEFAFLIQIFHFFRRGHITIIFSVSVNFAAALNSLDKFDRLFHTLTRQYVA